MRKLIFFFTFLCALFLKNNTNAQELSAIPTNQSLLTWLKDETPTEVVLETDFEIFKKERYKRAYHLAKITFTKSDGSTLNLKTQMKARGKFRHRACGVPPIKLKFKKKWLRAENLADLNELKVVIPCQETSEFEWYVAKEFLVYKLYNLLTDYSFQVMPINIHFHQSEKKRPAPAQIGFLIEDKEELKERLQISFYPDSLSLAHTQFTPLDYTRLQVFQFMIGNTDWVVPTRHNVETIQTLEKELIPIPYDFDFCGLINANYAIPNDKTDLTRVIDRLFMGNGKTREELQVVFTEFKKQKAAMLSLILDFELLPKSERKRMVRYIESFFDIIDSPALIKQYFLEKEDFRPLQY